MTEENTQQTTTIEKQKQVNAVQEEPKTVGKMKTVYYSTNEYPFIAVQVATDEITATQYPWVVTAPPADMQLPKFNWQLTAWEDHAQDAQAELITKTKVELKNIKASINALQNKNIADEKQYTELSAGQANIQQTLSQLTMMISQMVPLKAPKVTTTTDQPAGGTK